MTARNGSVRTSSIAAKTIRSTTAVDQGSGFSTSVVGNSISVDDERSKLETIARTAAAVWGGVAAPTPR